MYFFRVLWLETDFPPAAPTLHIYLIHTHVHILKKKKKHICILSLKFISKTTETTSLLLYH